MISKSNQNNTVKVILKTCYFTDVLLVLLVGCCNLREFKFMFKFRNVGRAEILKTLDVFCILTSLRSTVLTTMIFTLLK